MLQPLVLYFGGKQGPSLFQMLMDQTFGGLKVPDNEEFHSIFIDDVTIPTQAFEDDTDDSVVERHVQQCEIFLAKAKGKGIQFKMDKSKLAHEYIKLLGFKLGDGQRWIDPSKAQALKDWPAPRSCDDIVSFRAY